MILRIFVGLICIYIVSAVDPSIYRTCEEQDFCTRLRNKESHANFAVIRNAALVLADGVSLLLQNLETSRYVELNITLIETNIARITALEQDRIRYHIPYVLLTELQTPRPNVIVHEDTINVEFPGHEIIVHLASLQIDFFTDEKWIMTFNNHTRFSMESNDGSLALSFDVFFPEAIRAYGIPEHAESLSLKTTTSGSDPYRLYNSDTPGYEVTSTMALYGSVPLLYGHGLGHTAGIFLANAAEQWVDITNEEDGVTAFVMSEGGGLELYMLLGPTPKDVAVQYTNLTGTAPIPPLWSLGYHQSRWNYLDQDDVTEVIAEFDNHDIPIDVIWGDVETQDYHRYFTWNPDTFGDSVSMLNNLSATNRKFVTHVDPHYKVDSDYFVYAEGQQGGFFVKNADGSDFVGECWPGDSSWIDFFNEDAVEWYAGLFDYQRFNGSTATLAGIWNDMNEPAVFDDATEKTMNRSVVFNRAVPHRDVHNMYGFTQVRATYEGLMRRDDREVRPFVLSRSFFAGSQRYAAVWTGDNVADWEHLAISYPMCLTISLAGISMCGADVGGFLGDPDTELLTRWYQAGAWLPFFRAHASNGTARREPYLFEEEVHDRIRAAIRKRYTHLPLFYTLFYEHFRYGTPVIRPLFYEYPNDMDVVDIDEQIFVGSNVMVRPVDVAGATTVPVYFPGDINTLWYDIDSPLLYRGFRWITVDVNMDWIPVYYKGGSVIFKKTTARRNTYEMESDPYIVYVFLDDNNHAHGTIYQDDFHSFSYARREFAYFNLTYENDNALLEAIDDDMPSHDSSLVIQSYVVYRPPQNSRSRSSSMKTEPIVITKTEDGRDLKDLRYSTRTKTLIKLKI